jgi:opine dehydrogenase
MSCTPRICVLGGGNGAFATAADLKLRGFHVNLCEVPEMRHNLEPVLAAGGIDVRLIIEIPGLQPGFAQLDYVGTDPADALANTDLVFVVVPAFAQRRFAEFVAPFIRTDQLVALMPGNFGGTLEFASTMRARLGPNGPHPLLVDVECMIYSGFKEGASVEISGFKRRIACAAFPAITNPQALERLHLVYPGLTPARNVLEIGLRNGNTVIHPPITLLNAGWIEKTGGDFRFYWDGLTPAVGRVVEALDSERVATGRALGLDLLSGMEMSLGYYADQGAKGETYTEVLSTNPVYVIDRAPKQIEHRFLLEDIPYGLVPLESVARLAGVPTPISSALIDVASCMLQRDLRQQARDLKRLGLEGISLEGLLQLVDESGY